MLSPPLLRDPMGRRASKIRVGWHDAPERGYWKSPGNCQRKNERLARKMLNLVGKYQVSVIKKLSFCHFHREFGMLYGTR